MTTTDAIKVKMNRKVVYRISIARPASIETATVRGFF